MTTREKKIGEKLWWRPGERVARHYWCPKE